ncbi:hypothetical protein Ccrd_000214 [Cynara cardunculus var. scolymus]|uniref:Uncharacterized protein n=1 Tax=Cynara cardunculus var. scolymus TaxID=59895 RepID=A0A103XVK2_CYNCS|nr:hypothetical protein Ccrd_000214 [Cynara cardunculus var. scolymus]
MTLSSHRRHCRYTALVSANGPPAFVVASPISPIVVARCGARALLLDEMRRFSTRECLDGMEIYENMLKQS